jgi:PAS domain-containing protein
MMAGALCVCLATFFWCIVILRRRQKGPDRFLAVLIGVACIWQGMGLLREAGFIAMPGSHVFHSFADLTVTGLYLIAVLILKISAVERKNAQVTLRLVEANGQALIGQTSDQTVSGTILRSNALATIGMDKSGRVIYWNSAAERLLGWKAAEAVGKPNPISLTSPVRSKCGGVLRVQSWVSAMRDSTGRPCGSVLIIAFKPEPESNHRPVRGVTVVLSAS